jgi:hypothetical protein
VPVPVQEGQELRTIVDPDEVHPRILLMAMVEKSRKIREERNGRPQVGKLLELLWRLQRGRRWVLSRVQVARLPLTSDMDGHGGSHVDRGGQMCSVAVLYYARMHTACMYRYRRIKGRAEAGA